MAPDVGSVNSLHTLCSELEYLPARCNASCSFYSPLVIVESQPTHPELSVQPRTPGDPIQTSGVLSLLCSPLILHPTNSTSPTPKSSALPGVPSLHHILESVSCGTYLTSVSSLQEQSVFPCLRWLLPIFCFLAVYGKRTSVIPVTPSRLGMESHHICIQTWFLSFFFLPTSHETFQDSSRISFNPVSNA